MEFLRARREKGDAPGVKDPEPLESIDDIWTVAARVATVGIFVLLLGMCLYFCRPVLMPVVAALVIGTTLAPIVKAAARAAHHLLRGDPRRDHRTGGRPDAGTHRRGAVQARGAPRPAGFASVRRLDSTSGRA